MKILKSAGAVPGRSAAERRHASRNAVKSLRHMTPGETAAVSGWAVTLGTIVTAPAWWDCTGSDVLAASVMAFAALYIGMRTLPRAMRKNRRKSKIRLTFVTRRRIEGRRLGYVSTEAICAAARYAGGTV